MTRRTVHQPVAAILRNPRWIWRGGELEGGGVPRGRRPACPRKKRKQTFGGGDSGSCRPLGLWPRLVSLPNQVCEPRGTLQWESLGMRLVTCIVFFHFACFSQFGLAKHMHVENKHLQVDWLSALHQGQMGASCLVSCVCALGVSRCKHNCLDVCKYLVCSSLSNVVDLPPIWQHTTQMMIKNKNNNRRTKKKHENMQIS